jgi:hypothetical protein
MAIEGAASHRIRIAPAHEVIATTILVTNSLIDKAGNSSSRKA